MTLILPDIYTVGVLRSEQLTSEEKRAIRAVAGTSVTDVLVFDRLYYRGTMLHSKKYGREGGKRDSTVCSFLLSRKENFGTVQKFCICSNCPPLALVRPFEKTGMTFLQSIGRPGREILQEYSDIDFLSTFVVQVSKSPLPLSAVPISSLLRKCIQVSNSTLPHDFVIKLSNRFEHH